MPTLQETINQANQAGQQASQITGITFNPLNTGLGSPSIPQAITPQDLSGGSNLELPSTPVSTAIPAAKGAFEEGAKQASVLEQYLIEQDKQAKSASAESDKSLRSTMEGILDIPRQQTDLEKEADIAGKTKAQNEARAAKRANTNLLIQEQTALNRQVEEIEKNTQGMFSGAVQQEVNRVSRESLRKQADISLIGLKLSADFEDATFDLTSAQSLIDHKIALQLEPLKQKLEFDKFFADRNYDKLETSEKRIFDLLFAEDKRIADQTETDLKTAHSYLLKAGENGAPTSVFQAIQSAINSGNYDEARNLASPYLQSPTAGLDLSLKEAQLKNINSEIAKRNAETKNLNIPLITNPEAGKYSQALSVILGSGKFTKDQKESVINAVNAGEDPFTVVKNQAKNIMGQTLATDLDKYETAHEQLTNIDLLLKDYYAKGGATGIFTGNLEKVTNKLGEVKNPNLVEIATNIAAALQIYRNAVSGTAYSVQEGKDIASIFPGINKSQGLNQAILSGRMKAFNTTIDAKYRNTLGKTYDSLKTASVPAPTALVNPFTQSLSNIFNPQSGLFNIPD